MWFGGLLAIAVLAGGVYFARDWYKRSHVWGANATEWSYQKKHLAGRFRLITWDLPGLGLSKQPDTKDYSLENLAADPAV